MKPYAKDFNPKGLSGRRRSHDTPHRRRSLRTDKKATRQAANVGETEWPENAVWPCPLMTQSDTVDGTPLEIAEIIPKMIRGSAYECDKRARTVDANVVVAGIRSAVGDGKARLSGDELIQKVKDLVHALGTAVVLSDKGLQPGATLIEEWRTMLPEGETR